MSNLLEVPPLDESREIRDQTAFNLAVWERVLANPKLQEISERIETNAFGQIIMSPPPNFDHGRRQSHLAIAFSKISTPGTIVTECPLSTSDGVKAIDVAWISKEQFAQSTDRRVLTIAPEICVEVLSPSNTRREMAEKKALYFEAGAEEVWFCEGDGSLLIFRKDDPETSLSKSRFLSDLPEKME